MSTQALKCFLKTEGLDSVCLPTIDRSAALAKRSRAAPGCSRFPPSWSPRAPPPCPTETRQSLSTDVIHGAKALDCARYEVCCPLGSALMNQVPGGTMLPRPVGFEGLGDPRWVCPQQGCNGIKASWPGRSLSPEDVVAVLHLLQEQEGGGQWRGTWGFWLKGTLPQWH